MQVKVQGRGFDFSQRRRLFFLGSLAGEWAGWTRMPRGVAPALTSSPVLLTQVNMGILIAVTRVISQISADNYKIHGDPSAFKEAAPWAVSHAPCPHRMLTGGRRAGHTLGLARGPHDVRPHRSL